MSDQSPKASRCEPRCRYGYAREELVAELGSAFLCADLGITPEILHRSKIIFLAARMSTCATHSFLSAEAPAYCDGTADCSDHDMNRVEVG